MKERASKAGEHMDGEREKERTGVCTLQPSLPGHVCSVCLKDSDSSRPSMEVAEGRGRIREKQNYCRLTLECDMKQDIMLDRKETGY